MNESSPTPMLSDVWEALRQIIDPELGCNIVELGLVYEVMLYEHYVSVEMTLSSQGCPMGDILVAAATSALRATPGIEHAEVHLVWNPPWSVARMSPEARKQLGVPADV